MNAATSELNATSSVEEPILRACRLIEQSDPSPSLDELAAAAGMSRYRFYRMFIRALGVTPKAYSLALRRERLQKSLQNAPGVAEAVFDAGFGSGSRVYEKPEALLGMTPGAYRKGAPGVQIRSAIANSALGLLMVAASGKGVCMIEFGETRSELRANLRRRFPEADLEPGDDKLDRWLQRVIDYLRMPSGSLDLPLDIQGTAFQQQVWQVLQSVPAGETVTYAQVAQQVGKPTAVRAVARAIASNRLAVAIPCHRVVGSDGQLRGYRWGLERKKQLLDRENQASARPDKRKGR
ncbi:MAG: methylated-DNA--[protein]-cysteine S-methyltransferase [Betaproteobacteria bacterium]|nr:MAG: methylated-DNA--[protein]-cysteine S-methyltransferase [Betaproteobacteria bacterium]